jgi:hypothetical protein
MDSSSISSVCSGEDCTLYVIFDQTVMIYKGYHAEHRCKYKYVLNELSALPGSVAYIAAKERFENGLYVMDQLLICLMSIKNET